MRQVGRLFGVCYLPREEWSVSVHGDVITRVYRTAYANWRASVPLYGSPHPLAPFCLLISAIARQIEGGPLCDVALRYEESGGDPLVTPPTEVSESGSVIEVDIRQHPSWSAWAEHWDAGKQAFKSSAPSYLLGVSKYVVGSSTVTVTKYTSNKPAPVQGDLGQIINPGHGYGETGHWLVTTGYVSKRGAFWGRTLVYQYSSRPVPMEIYPQE